MNWTQVEGKWEQMIGKTRSQWAKLTDDDLANIKGKRDQLVGKIVERYGVLKEDAERQIDTWLAKIDSRGNKDDTSHTTSESR